MVPVKKTLTAFTCAAIISTGCAAPVVMNSVVQPKPKVVQVKKVEAKPIVKKQPKKTYEVYGDHIIYFDFSKLSKKNIPQENITLPHNLKKFMSEKGYSIAEKSNDKKVEELVWIEAKKQGHNKRTVAKLGTIEALMLGVKIVTDKIEYVDVDSDKAFIAKHGADLSLEKYFEMGKGDCERYTLLFKKTINSFKKLNPNLKNIYVSGSKVGGYVRLHEWNSVIIAQKDALLVSHIDLTYYDNDKTVGLDGERGHHVPENLSEFHGRLYRNLSNYVASYTLYSRALSQLKSKSDKARILGDMSYLAWQLEDKQKMDSIRKRYSSLKTGDHGDSILYYSYKMEKEKGSKEKAEKFKRDLIQKYPHSYWAKDVQTDN